MRQKDLANRIREKVLNGSVTEEFRAVDFDFLRPNSLNFIWKHSDKNLKLVGNQYYVWVRKGIYRLK